MVSLALIDLLLLRFLVIWTVWLFFLDHYTLFLLYLSQLKTNKWRRYSLEINFCSNLSTTDEPEPSSIVRTRWLLPLDWSSKGDEKNLVIAFSINPFIQEKKRFCFNARRRYWQEVQLLDSDMDEETRTTFELDWNCLDIRLNPAELQPNSFK